MRLTATAIPVSTLQRELVKLQVARSTRGSLVEFRLHAMCAPPRVRNMMLQRVPTYFRPLLHRDGKFSGPHSVSGFLRPLGSMVFLVGTGNATVLILIMLCRIAHLFTTLIFVCIRASKILHVPCTRRPTPSSDRPY